MSQSERARSFSQSDALRAPKKTSVAMLVKNVPRRFPLMPQGERQRRNHDHAIAIPTAIRINSR